MFWKLAIAIGLAVVAARSPSLSRFWPWVLVIGVIVAFVIEGVRIVPQQSAWVVERLGRFHGMLEPGLNLIIPFLDRVAYRHSLKEVPLDVPEQVCITQGQHAARRRRHPLLPGDRSAARVVRLVELHRRDHASSRRRRCAARSARWSSTRPSSRATRSTGRSSPSLDEAGRNWGIKVLRYEIKSLTPPEAILRSMQAQITAEREKRALIAKSEGERQQEINVADGEKQAAVLQVRGREAGGDQQARRARRPRSASSPRPPPPACARWPRRSATRAAWTRPTSRWRSSTSRRSPTSQDSTP